MPSSPGSALKPRNNWPRSWRPPAKRAEQIRATELAEAGARAESQRRIALEAARKAAETESAQALQKELARVQQAHDDRLAAELERTRQDAERAREELLAASELKVEQIREETEAKTLLTAEAEAQRALEAELSRLQSESDAQRAEEMNRVRAQAEVALSAQLAEAGAEAERVRTDATRQAREVAEAAAESTLRTEIERVRADTEKTLSEGLVKLRREEDERRERQLSEITTQIAQLKDAAAEQAKTAADEALKSELDRVRESKTVHERVVRLAPEPVAVAPTVVAQPSFASAESHVSDGDATTEASVNTDYYSLFRGGAAQDETDDPETAPPARRVNLRQVFLGIGAAAVILLGFFMGTGSLDDRSTGLILIEGPPGAQVWVEGQLIGETPLPEISADVGDREVVVLHPEAGEVRQTVVVNADSPAILTLGGTGDDAEDQ